MTIEEAIRMIERDREEREEGLLLWLLLLAGRARRYVNRAIRLGVAWPDVLQWVLLGNPDIDQPGGVPFLSRAMADSHLAGYRRVGRLVGMRLESPVTLAELAPAYVLPASRVMERAIATLIAAISEALGRAVTADSIAADVRAVGEAVARAGWVEESSRNAAAEATSAVTQAYAGGMRDGLDNPAVAAVLSGLRFVNPMDARTTDICRKRHGVKLPLDHPWWFASWPPLHVGCRSVVLPVTDRIAFTENPPTFPPPTPGWGHWNGLLTAFSPRATA